MSDHTQQGPPSRFDVMVPMKPAVITATLLIVAWLLFMLYETTNMFPPILPGYPGDSFFPRLVIAYGLICGAVILLRATMLPRGAPLVPNEDTAFRFDWFEFLTVCVLVIAYGELLRPVGFEITTFVLMMVLLTPRFAAGGYDTGRSLLYAFALSLPTMLLFYVGFGLLLRIPLPLLFLPRYIHY